MLTALVLVIANSLLLSAFYIFYIVEDYNVKKGVDVIEQAHPTKVVVEWW